jgi:hypothetical protein
MNYITIADLKKQAKKERKNNNSIKNHADSLNLVAKQNNFDSWSDLIDKSVILKKENLYTQAERLSMLKTFINDATIHLNELTTIFKIENHDVLSIKMTKNFIDPVDDYSNGDSLWRDRAISWLDKLCFIFINSDIPKTFQGFRSMMSFPDLLKVIYRNHLQHEEQVKNLFDMMYYEYDLEEIKEPEYDVLQQYGYCSMQATGRFGFTENLFKFINLNENTTKDHVKNMILHNTSLFTMTLSSRTNMLDPHKIFKRYRASFDNEADFKNTLRNDLYP